MNPEHGYREIKEQTHSFGPVFDPDELTGLFKYKGKDKGLLVHHNTFHGEDVYPAEILEDILSNLKLSSNSDTASYFADNFIHDLSHSLGQAGLKILFTELKRQGIEWGAQLKPETVTPKLARQMKEYGCTYVQLDMPTVRRELLLAAGYEETKQENIERALEILDNEGIRIGLGLEFGISGYAEKSGSKFEVRETKQSIIQTIDFVKNQLSNGRDIVGVSMSLFNDPTARNNSDVQKKYPYNRFLNGEQVKTNLDRQTLDFIVKTSVKEIGEALRGQDLYSVDKIYGKARWRKLADFIDLNSASLGVPRFTEDEMEIIETIRVDARHLTETMSNSRDYHLAAEPEMASNRFGKNFFNTIERARLYLAAIMGVKDRPNSRSKILKYEPGARAEDHIAIAPNTTQAINWALGMVAVREDLLNQPPDGSERNYLITDAEHYSVRRMLRKIVDKTNIHGRESAASFQDYGKGYIYTKDSKFKPQTLHWKEKVGKVLEQSNHFDIASQVDANTKMVILSHVLRDTGEILDVTKITRAIKSRNPNCWVLVDGAQALGALSDFSVEDIGCDFYVATPHKTLNSYPFGVLYMNDRSVKLAQKLIKAKHSGKLNIQLPRYAFNNLIEYSARYTTQSMVEDGLTSPYEPWSFVLNFYPKEGMDPKARRIDPPDITDQEVAEVKSRKKIHKSLEAFEYSRESLKRNAKEKLEQAFGESVEILSPQDAKHSNFILSFTFPGLDNRAIVEDLWTNYHIGLTYIARSNCIRSSFSPFNTNTETDKLVKALKKVTQNPQYKINL